MDVTSQISGKSYKTVIIGNQEWMAENLDIQIPGSVDNGKYGRLYSYEEALEAVKIYNLEHATKWHLPTNAEWTALGEALGGLSVAGGKMKQTGTSLWNAPNTGATNESGWNGLPGGYYYTSSGYGNKGHWGYWWSAESYNIWTLSYNDAYLNGPNTWNNNYRASVRCVKGILEGSPFK